jgi:hypothetical protein
MWMLVEIPQPWNPAQATERIRAIAQGIYDLWLTGHAKDQMEERELIVGDVQFLLRNGFVFDPPIPATRPDFFKYLMESKTPNSGARDVRVSVIPDWTTKALKIPTVMWKDEPLISR